MSRRPDILVRVLEATQMTKVQLAELLDLPVGALDGPPTPTVLARCARGLGTSLEDLLAGQIGPAARLFRSLDGSGPALHLLARDGTALRMGGDVQDMRQARLVEDLLDATRPSLPAWAVPEPIPTTSRPPHDGEVLAARVRRELGLGDEPVTSVWALARRLGIEVAAVSPDHLPPWIDGFSWREPFPGLIVNLIGGATTWWRTRMTVAHEIAHVLFDLAPEQGLIVSADKVTGPLYLAFEAIEQRANAFAAYLLAPPSGVRRLAGSRSPTDPSFLADLCRTYGVGVHTGANVITNLFQLSSAQRAGLLDRFAGREVPQNLEHDDASAPPTPRRRLEVALERALDRGVVDPARARAMLGLRMSDPLGLGTGTWPDPLLGLESLARRAVQRHLHALGEDHLAPDAIRLLPGGGLAVDIVDATPGAKTRIVKTLCLTRDLRIADAA